MNTVLATAPIYACWTKMIGVNPGPPRSSSQWAHAQRGRFKVFTDRLECGDMVFPHSEIADAILYRARTALLFSINVLEITTREGKSYHFGFNPWAYPQKFMKIPYTEKRVRLRMSPLARILRLAVVTYLVYWIWIRYKSGA